MKNLFEDDQISTETGRTFSRLYNIIRSLRGPQGCPWDKEQTLESLRSALLEESQESIDAINHGDKEHIKEELGDVLLVIMLMGYIAEQENKFSVEEVLLSLNDKLVRRHPHVFGDAQVSDSDEVLIQWDKIKRLTEGRGTPPSSLDSVPTFLPTLDRAYKLQKKASKQGFDWQDYQGVLEKIREELDEVEDVITRMEEQDTAPQEDNSRLQTELEHELGDLLFAVVNLTRKVGVHPNDSLSRTNAKFYQRFSYIENKMKELGLEMGSENLDQMERFWLEAKRKNM